MLLPPEGSHAHQDQKRVPARPQPHDLVVPTVEEQKHSKEDVD